MDIGSYLERIKVIDLMNNKIIAMVKDMLNEGTNRIYSISKDEAKTSNGEQGKNGYR